MRILHELIAMQNFTANTLFYGCVSFSFVLGLYFFTFSARGQIDESSYYYERVRNSHEMNQYGNVQERDNMPIVIDKSRNRYYYRPGKNNLGEEWE